MIYRHRSFDCRIYEEELRKLGRGVPVYSPSSSSDDYRVHVGDVGYFHDGLFRPVFNAFANTEETRAWNEEKGTPEGFVPVPDEFMETVVTENSAPPGSVFKWEPEDVAHTTPENEQEARGEGTGSEARLNRLRSISRILGSGGESSSSEIKEHVAILTIKQSATRISSLHVRDLKQYVLANYESWYRLLHDERQYGINLHDLMFITECEFTANWSTRVWSQETSRKNRTSRSRLGPLGNLFTRWSEENTTSCIFPERHGPMRNGTVINYDEKPDDEIPRDQCIFLKCFWVKDRAIDRESDKENDSGSYIVTTWPEPDPSSLVEEPHEFALNTILKNSKADVAIVYEPDVLAIAEAMNYRFEKHVSLKKLQYKGEAIKVTTERDPKSGKLVGTLVHKDSELAPSIENTVPESGDSDDDNQRRVSGVGPIGSALQSGLKLLRGKK